MKRVIASVGLVALGVAGLQSVKADNPSKLWSASATLRGFYDDNPNTVPSGANKTGSFGFEVSPSLGLAWNPDQNILLLNYNFTGKYYEKAFSNTENEHWDYSHTFDAIWNHTFSERYQLSVRNSFVIGQEPDVLRVPNAPGLPFQHISGNNIRNYGSITFNAQLTPLLGIEAGYANGFYDYVDRGATADPAGHILASYAGALNRLEHTLHFDTRWQVQPETVAVVGYQYIQVDYTGNELISGLQGFSNPGSSSPLYPFYLRDPQIPSDARNSHSHLIDAGLDHSFGPNFTGSFRVGAQYIDFYNNPNGPNTTHSDVSPYATGSLKCTYSADTFWEAGFSYSRAASDIVGTTTNGISKIATDAQSAIVYGSLTHSITPKLRGSVTAQFQESTYNGGIDNNETDFYYLLGLNLQYFFTPHFSADVGYNYDRLNSNISGRNFGRDRVYTGVTASF